MNTESKKQEEAHTHVHVDGTVHTHVHGAGESYEQSHPHSKEVINRLAKAIGHLQSVKRMVEEGRDCSEVLVQLAAVKSAINNTGKVILSDHITHCIVDAVEDGEMDRIDDLNDAIQKFVK